MLIIFFSKIWLIDQLYIRLGLKSRNDVVVYTITKIVRKDNLLSRAINQWEKSTLKSLLDVQTIIKSQFEMTLLVQIRLN